MNRVLITGGGGQLASDLALQLAPHARVHAPPHEELDVTDGAAVAAALRDLRPDTVFNCAAFHNLEVCEREEGRAFEVNATAVKGLAARCAEEGARLVHVSTNYVFDGGAPRPYREDDPPAPRSVYAISKLAGEHAALAYAPRSLVVRSSGLYGVHGGRSRGGNFVTRALASAREDGILRMVRDQRLTPTYTADLATALVTAVDAGLSGILHLTNAGECTWLEFTEAIMDLAGVAVTIEPVASSPDGVDRPRNGVLAMTVAERAGLPPLRHWREALADYMESAGLSAAQPAGRGARQA